MVFNIRSVKNHDQVVVVLLCSFTGLETDNQVFTFTSFDFI